MNENKTINLLEFITLILTLSYFYINNILLVLVGISLSLYLINSNFINSLIRSMNRILTTKKQDKISNKKDEVIRVDYRVNKLNGEESRLTLAETIEELGFIPSLDKKEDRDAA